MPHLYKPMVCALQQHRSGALIWVARYQRPDGGFHAHAFPRHTPHCRAAEYGVDPEDTETLLDMILHEVHVQPGDPDHDTDIYRMPVDAARAMHLRRIGHVREHHVDIDHRHDAFAGFYRGHGVTPAAVDALAAQVEQLRAQAVSEPAGARFAAPGQLVLPNYLPHRTDAPAHVGRPRPGWTPPADRPRTPVWPLVVPT